MNAPRLAAAALLLCTACPSASDGFPAPAVSGGDPIGMMGTTEVPDVPPEVPDAGEPDGGSTEDTGSDDARFDVPPDTDVPPVEPCQAVDLLFVIDNSGSMADEQLNLIGSFPGFIAGIEDTLGAQTSYHVGVVTTDQNTFNDAACRQIGALTTKTGGDLSSDAECGPFNGGDRFMTTEDDLSDAFACAAHVGIDGSGIERPMDALAAALHGNPPQTGDCNEGFLRDEALLVVVLITDEEDDGDSLGNPSDWVASVVDAKGGDEEKIVALSLVGFDKPNDCLPAQWTGMQGAEISPRLIAFTESFTYGFVRDVCSDNYAAYFEDAVSGIETACAIPVG